MCAARSRLSETLMSEDGRSRSVRQRGKLGKEARGKSLVLPCSEFFLPLSRLPLVLQSPSLFSSYLLPLIFCLTLFALCTFLSLSLTHTHALTHVRLSRRLHTRLQLGNIQRLPPFPDSFQFGSEPPGHCSTAQCLHTPPY